MPGSPGLRRRPLGHRVGGCGWCSLGLQGPLREAERREGVPSWTPAPASAPGRAPSRGDESLQERAEWRRFRGKRKALSSAGGCRRTRDARNITHDTHTCWAICSAHSGASSSSRTPGRATSQTDTYTHTFIRTYVSTDIPPAHQRPLGHSHQLRILLRRLHDQQRGHTTRGHR